MDNLPSSLYEAFDSPNGWSTTRPSIWLNMAEIELGVQCLDRRIPAKRY